MLKLPQLQDCMLIYIICKKIFDAMRSTEKSTKKRILCGYVSADQVRQHAKRMGSICLVAGTPYREIGMGLSLDRPLDDFHHCPEDCLLIHTHLNQSLHRQPSRPGKHLHSTAGKWGLMILPPIMQKCVPYLA